MGTVSVDYYDAECRACGWMHRVMIGGGMGSLHATNEALRIHARRSPACVEVTEGRCDDLISVELDGGTK